MLINFEKLSIGMFNLSVDIGSLILYVNNLRY